MKQVKIAIENTLLYSSIFGSGLTKEDLWTYLISDIHIKKNDFLKTLANVHFNKVGDYYILKPNKKLKVFSSKESVRKLAIVSKISKKLSLIPTVLFIGVSGSTAYFHASKEDDIDIFIICENKSIWITRLLLLIVLEFSGLRRKKRANNVSNKICLNMLIERKEMALKKERQEIYTANEIAHLIPLFQRDATYAVFMKKNKWILQMLPNVFSKKKNIFLRTKKKNKTAIVFLCFLNTMSKFFQLVLMERKRKKEVVSDSLLAFHPFDYRFHILREYDKRKRKYGIE